MTKTLEDGEYAELQRLASIGRAFETLVERARGAELVITSRRWDCGYCGATGIGDGLPDGWFSQWNIAFCCRRCMDAAMRSTRD